MKTIIHILFSGILAYVFMLILVPVIKRIALTIGLTDQPNARKLHIMPVPLVGGISIAITTILLTFVNTVEYAVSSQLGAIFASSLLLLVTGIIDDKYDLKAKYKLSIQLFCAFIIAASGTRIVTLYGLFGIQEIPPFVQYALTMLVICGVVNAFNLMDGIDGIVGFLGLLGLVILGIFSYLIHQYALTLISVTLIGSMIGFLKFNLNTDKIFMGDAGSLFIGNILICSSIYLLNRAQTLIVVKPVFLYTTIGYFSLPVLDSVRVYLERMKKGMSPFSADKSHIHHLFLLMGLSHKQISMLITAITISILLATLLINGCVSLTVSVLFIVTMFSALAFILNLNKKVRDWTLKLKRLEE